MRQLSFLISICLLLPLSLNAFSRQNPDGAKLDAVQRSWQRHFVEVKKKKGIQERIRIRPGQSVQVTLALNLSTQAKSHGDWKLFLAAPPNLYRQRQVHSELHPNGKRKFDNSYLHSPYFQINFDKQGDEGFVQAIQDTVCQLSQIDLIPLAIGQKAEPMKVQAHEKRLALWYSSSLFDYRKDRFGQWMDAHHLHPTDDETELDFARRVFLTLKHIIMINQNEKQLRRASHVAQKSSSDSAGISIIYCSVLRAHGIPARTLWGRWLYLDHGDEDSLPHYKWHVKSEFYVPEVGWVPVDLASAIMRDKKGDSMEYFGREAGDFITYQVDLSMGVRGESAKENSSIEDLMFWAKGPGSKSAMKWTSDWMARRLSKSF